VERFKLFWRMLDLCRDGFSSNSPSVLQTIFSTVHTVHIYPLHLKEIGVGERW
jgi:hypothetical protein